jgi:hypothetical protein
LPKRAGAAAALSMALLALLPPEARATPIPCHQTVVFTLPGMTWSDVQQYRPPAILALAGEGARGSVSVRTNSVRTSYASGFATIGAGARVDGGKTTGAIQATSSGAPVPARRDGRLLLGVQAGGVSEVRELAGAQGYGAEPGALGAALDAGPEGAHLVAAVGNADPGMPPPVPFGGGRWSLYSAMGGDGFADRSATGRELLDRDATAPYGVRTDPVAVEDALSQALQACAVTIVDPGDLERVDQAAMSDPSFLGDERRQAIAAADVLLGFVAQQLDPASDLLLVVTPTSPWWAEEAHLGIAIARGPGFAPDTTLVSASTRRPGFVTLPDVAPTILHFLHLAVPAEMNGQRWEARGGSTSIAQLVAEDEEAVFVDSLQGRISTGFIIFQVLVYASAIALLTSRRRRGSLGRVVGLLEAASLAIVAFPVSTYLMGVFDGHSLGTLWYVLVLSAIALALALVVTLAVGDPLDRLLAVAASTVVVIGGDLVLGGHLQIETVFGYSPIVAGRFAGIGNISFAVLSAATLLTATLLVHRNPGRNGLVAAGLLCAAVVVLDGAPQLGSDVGGVVALVPGLGITLVLLSGRRPDWRIVVGAIVVALACLGIFLAIDLARAPDNRTHLARLFEDVRERGLGAFGETVKRKAEANLRVFKSSIWTFFVPPALAVLGWLLLRPRGRWRELASTYPKPRAGLAGGLLLAILAFAVNDSGIVIPAVILSFLVPMALVVHLLIESRARAEDES